MNENNLALNTYRKHPVRAAAGDIMMVEANIIYIFKKQVQVLSFPHSVL